MTGNFYNITLEDNEVNPNKFEWVENCQNCHCPMTIILINQKLELQGVTNSVKGVVEDEQSWSEVFRSWLVNPVVPSNGQFWKCKKCQSIWTLVKGSWWTKVEIREEI